MYHPESTYRVQLHRDFNFTELEKIIPYLHRLGIKTVYASPVFAALPGSTHGYDGVNPNEINPEIGTWQQFEAICSKLKSLGMGWLQDFVPNHMAFSPANPWIYDVLKNGPASAYYHYFDIRAGERLMLPVLDSDLQEAIESKHLQLVLATNGVQLRYAATEYPLNNESYAMMTDAAALPVPEQLEAINAAPVLLRSILDKQYYRLCNWRETSSRINYRRFFTINGLIGVNIHLDDVFDDYHRLLLRMVREELVQGIRIDHIDGLLDPTAYLHRLREQVGPDTYICVEKILGDEEHLPADWPVQGTTGYDFINKAARVMVTDPALQRYRSAYGVLLGERESVAELIRRYKERILYDNFSGELDHLLALFLALPGLVISPMIDAGGLKNVIAQILVCCPVYRFYPETAPLQHADLQHFDQLMQVVATRKGIVPAALQCLRTALTGSTSHQDHYAEKVLDFWRQCMQLAGPLMAKGVEDTLHYNYMPFLALNEVGVPPDTIPLDTAAFHADMQYRAQYGSDTLNATATHDTKRGEDSRARLLQAGADPAEWLDVFNAGIPVQTEQQPLPEDRYFLLQAIYAALPYEPMGTEWAERLRAYLSKATREAKRHSGWETPDLEYENSLAGYALAIASPESALGKSLHAYLERQREAAVRNSLVQLVLKCTCPGVADIYQGTELWDWSFVDPDNRRPVDYEKLSLMLDGIIERDGTAAGGVMCNDDIKLYTLYHLLQLRKQYPDLFLKGSYEPLPVTGRWISFVRRYEGQWLWVLLPLPGAGNSPDTLPLLPGEAPATWQHLFCTQQINTPISSVEEVCSTFPVFVAHAAVPTTTRLAGILMPLSALPSDEGVGNIGDAAHDFIDFLAAAGQKLWQMLPLNPLLAANAFSPYAAASAFANDPVYIDTQRLQTDQHFQRQLKPVTDKQDITDFASEQARKEELLYAAWLEFKQQPETGSWRSFQAFVQKEKWLDDYALYTVLKAKHNHRPWYAWPAPYRDRDAVALDGLRASEQDRLLFEQWKQFVFQEQWQALKRYAAQRNIKLLGDVPFYMSTDSADVWANPALFRLDTAGQPSGISGVPPDYFSATGQLWGMPTYNWQAMAQTRYAWWLDRLDRNIAMYDIVRLDHFRAFYDYWEVPAGEPTAINGSWRKGPADELFRLLQQHFPVMPFLAEDLGELHKGVTAFREQYALPGMYVLQFAFDNYDPTYSHLPHNFDKNAFVYSGTHDNNTSRGWFRELDAAAKIALNAYAGYEVTEETAAQTLIRLAYASVARTVVIPMQDHLNLDALHRINTPATATGNWVWRLSPGILNEKIAQQLWEMVCRFNR